jgi:hypothetical protein
VEPTRAKEKRKAKEELAENNTREEALAVGKIWGEIKLGKNRVQWRHFVDALGSSGS